MRGIHPFPASPEAAVTVPACMHRLYTWHVGGYACMHITHEVHSSCTQKHTRKTTRARTPPIGAHAHMHTPHLTNTHVRAYTACGILALSHTHKCTHTHTHTHPHIHTQQTLRNIPSLTVCACTACALWAASRTLTGHVCVCVRHDHVGTAQRLHRDVQRGEAESFLRVRRRPRASATPLPAPGAAAAPPRAAG